MKSLERSTVFENHSHVVFRNEMRGYGMTSFDANHAHQLQYIPEVPESQDPNTGQPIPGQPARWEWSPGPDGHVHDGFEPIPVNKKSPFESTPDDALKEAMQLFNTWYENERLSIISGQESEDFVAGKQWDEATRSKLNAESRACLTNNRIANKLDTLSGYERSQRKEIRYVPQEGGDQKAADLYNVLAKQLLDKCNFWDHKSESFEDLVSAGKGSWNIRISRDDDLRGDVIVERYPWDQSCFGPFEQKDTSDAEGFCKFRWYSKSRAKQLWPDHADDIENCFALDLSVPAEVDLTRPGEQTGPLGQQSNPTGLLSTQIDVEKRNILVIECQRIVYIQVPVLANTNEDFYVNAWGWDKKDIEAARTIPGFLRVDRNIKKIRITKVAGGKVLLSDENPADLPSDNFHFISFYAKRKRGQYWGKVEQVKDIQLQINKCASQAVDIGNRMCSYNWFYDQDTFPQAELRKFLATSAEPGAAFQVNSTSKLPVKSEGVKFPSEIVQLMQLHEQSLDDALNIIPEPGGANESGQALLQKTELKLKGNEYLFDAITSALYRLGRLLIPVIRKYYPPERIVRIVRNRHAQEPIAIGDDLTLDDFTDEDITDILRQNDLEKFDLVVTETGQSPSARIGNYLILTDLMAKGADVPIEMVIQYADMPAKDKQQLLSRLQQQQDAQNQAQSTAGDAEIEKTLVAKNIIPPSVAQRFGIPATTQPIAPEGGAPTGLDEGAPMQEPAPALLPQQQAPQVPPITVNVAPPQFSLPPIAVHANFSKGGTKIAHITRNEAGDLIGTVSDVDNGQ